MDVKEKKHILQTTAESQKSLMTYFQSFRLWPSGDFFVLIENSNLGASLRVGVTACTTRLFDAVPFIIPKFQDHIFVCFAV